ncbi:ATP-binding cassette domain-containing protein [Candidatus Albibeggiatoa sp. nov. BB20]|uniref:ABC transporter ATP-binding protein n=1 Tax=Candidatus Albibeggiatoa sp. nov. BB20 TaxID=3162723 RepID=UPI0033653E89
MPAEELKLSEHPNKRELAEQNIILHASNLYIEYDNEALLQNINLSIRYGSTVSIRGDVGIGKSSLLRILGLLSSPNAGSVYLSSSSKRAVDDYQNDKSKKTVKIRDYYDCSALPHPEREDIIKTYFAYIFQSHELMMQWDAMENISLPLFARGFSAKNRMKKARALCRQLDIEDIMHKPMYQLSGGQRQLVNIARALAKEPTILIADEPSSSLDPTRKSMVFNLFQQLADEKQMTIIVATHNLDAVTFFDYHYIIRNKGVLKYIEKIGDSV